MAIEVPPKVSELTNKVVQTTTQATKSVLRFLSRVFKPGGWHYLRPVEPTDQTPEPQPEQEEAPVKRRKAA